MFKNFKKWAWSRPEYKNDKVVDAVDKTLEVSFDNEVVNTLGDGIDKILSKIQSISNPKWLEKYDTVRKD